MRRLSVVPDTNIWRDIVDADAVEPLRRAAREHAIDIVACPAVLYEGLRYGEPLGRRSFAKTLTRAEWIRPMPEAFVEAENVRGAITRHRPEWLLELPALTRYNRNRSDWLGPFWRRARANPGRVSRHVDKANDGDLDIAREEAAERRAAAATAGNTVEGLTLSRNLSFRDPVPGWDGRPFAAWRSRSMTTWWENVVLGLHDTYADWLEEWLDLATLRTSRAAWISFWTREVSAEELPREWIRWAMTEVQSVRKVTPGTPVDNQIATYLPDFDIFVTADKGFVSCLEAIRPHAPVPLAQVRRSPGGPDAVSFLHDLFKRLRVAELWAD